jgi:hypothetical protein
VGAETMKSAWVWMVVVVVSAVACGDRGSTGATTTGSGGAGAAATTGSGAAASGGSGAGGTTGNGVGVTGVWDSEYWDFSDWQ